MATNRPLAVARISVETSTSVDLGAVCRWLIQRHGSPLSLGPGDLPALGQNTRLRLALPVTAPRAVLCALWLLEDLGAGCLLAGHLRFVAHPTGSDIRLSFIGRTAEAMRSISLGRHADLAARQLIELISDSIQRPAGLRTAASAG
ncbi:MAG TPA: hypothetical protein VF383_09820 [Candidatus Dormibacteraeota bacterium]